jgi:hypothetical protein
MACLSFVINYIYQAIFDPNGSWQLLGFSKMTVNPVPVHQSLSDWGNAFPTPKSPQEGRVEKDKRKRGSQKTEEKGARDGTVSLRWGFPSSISSPPPASSSSSIRAVEWKEAEEKNEMEEDGS